jgi:hypothetical protein
LQHADIEPAIQVIVTELGIEKSHDIAFDEEACSKVVGKVKEELAPVGDGEGMGSQDQFRGEMACNSNFRPLSISPI